MYLNILRNYKVTKVIVIRIVTCHSYYMLVAKACYGWKWLVFSYKIVILSWLIIIKTYLLRTILCNNILGALEFHLLFN